MENDEKLFIYVTVSWNDSKENWIAIAFNFPSKCQNSFSFYLFYFLCV